MKILKANQALLSMVPEKHIYAVIAHEDTPFPYIVYSVQLNVTYTKDVLGAVGHYNTATITVDVFGETYSESAVIANQVRAALENYGYRDQDIKVAPIELDSTIETYDDCFVHTLIFRADIQ